MTAPRDGITRRPVRPVSPACYPVPASSTPACAFRTGLGCCLASVPPRPRVLRMAKWQHWQQDPSGQRDLHSIPMAGPVALCDACYFVIYVLSHLWKLLLLMVFNIMAQTGKKRVPFWLIERSTELHTLAASCQLPVASCVIDLKYRCLLT